MHLNTNPAYLVGCDCTVSPYIPACPLLPCMLRAPLAIDPSIRLHQDGCRDPTKCRCAGHMGNAFA